MIRTLHFRWLGVLSLAIHLLSCGGQGEIADVIFHNGQILTMEGDEPEYVECLAVKDGKILYAGASSCMRKYRGNGTKVIDLEGKFMMPGWVESYGNLLSAAYMRRAVHLHSAVSGDGGLARVVLDKILAEIKTRKPENLLVVIHVSPWLLQNPSKLPSRDALDSVSKDIPVVVVNSFFSMGVANSKALEGAGLLPSDLKGLSKGRLGKDPSGNVRDFFEGKDFCSILSLFANNNLELSDNLLQLAIQEYLSNGVTTAQHACAKESEYRLLKGEASQSALPLDLILYWDRSEFDRLNAGERVAPGKYDGRLKVGGIYIKLSDSTGAKPASAKRKMDIPACIGRNESVKDLHDYERFSRLISKYHENNIQVLVHAESDAASVWLLNALKEAERNKGKRDLRFALVNPGISDIVQLDILKQNGIYSTFSSSCLLQDIDQPTDAAMNERISGKYILLDAALEKNTSVGIFGHLPCRQLEAIQCFVFKQMRSRTIPADEVKRYIYTALKASTLWAAYMYHEENRKGSLRQGKLADVIILDANPMEIEVKHLHKIKVLETFKEGNSVFKRR